MTETGDGITSLHGIHDEHLKDNLQDPGFLGKGWDGIVGYLTSHEAYCLWVGNY